jgi:hypothetical protein
MTTAPISSMTERFDSPLAEPGARRANGSASAAPNPEVVAVAKRLSTAEDQAGRVDCGALAGALECPTAQ